MALAWVDVIGELLPRVEIFQGLFRQLRGAQAAGDGQLRFLLEVDDQRFGLGDAGFVDDQRGPQRQARVHAQDQGVTFVFQLYQAAWRVDAHAADKGLQRHLVVALALLLEHQRQGLVRAECLARVERVAQIVERVDQADHPAQAADGGFAQALRVAAAVAVFVVLLDDPQHFVVEHQFLAVAHAELTVQLQQLLLQQRITLAEARCHARFPEQLCG